MPKYHTFQYGLGRYGLYGDDPITPGTRRPFVLKPCRMCLVRGDQKVWVYQAAPITLTGERTRFRLSSNRGGRIQNQTATFNGKSAVIRMRTNRSEQTVTSRRQGGTA